MKISLVIFTNNFPDSEMKSEIWLENELKTISAYFDEIILIPHQSAKRYISLPKNVSVLNIEETNQKVTLTDFISCIKILLNDFMYYPSKRDYLKYLRYNLALLKQIHKNAYATVNALKSINTNFIFYSYWSDNLLTKAVIIKNKIKNNSVLISRGHGFDVFEDQTLHGVIPFRGYQYKHLDKLISVSKRGYLHLISNKKYLKYNKKNAYSYLGILNTFKNNYPFDATKPFTIVTCSIVRNVKRLQLMPEILKHINSPLVWHVLGNGEDLENLKELCMHLPKNINVIFHGALSNENILNFYKNNHINIFCSLSSSEGLPVSMMEAQSFGIPIMSTNVGGCNEICNNETGFLIEKYFNPKDVAEKLENFKNSAKNTIQFHEKCRLYWELNFNAEKNYKNFAKTITELVQ